MWKAKGGSLILEEPAAPQQVRNFSLLGTRIFQAHKTSPAAIVITESQLQQPSRGVSSRVLQAEETAGWREKVTGGATVSRRKLSAAVIQGRLETACPLEPTSLKAGRRFFIASNSPLTWHFPWAGL